MIDHYIILHRKTNFMIKFFIYNVLFLMILVIWMINTYPYQNFFHIHSKILNLNSHYYLEVLIPIKEVQTITKKNIMIINSKEYNYQIIQADQNVSYINKENYQKLLLEIQDLDEQYKINGYHLEIKIEKDKKKIIDYLKE